VTGVLTIAADHVVYGTGFPFDMAAGPPADQLAGTGLGGAAVAAIASGNAALFGRTPPGSPAVSS
jgi:hypothetical protein